MFSLAHSVFCIFLLILSTFGIPRALADIVPTAETQPAAEVQPADVFMAVQQFNEEIEFFRSRMDRPKSIVLDVQIRNASPHDVYFLASSLFEKANRLSFEITSTRFPWPKISSKIYKPSDVLALVEASHHGINAVMAELGVVVEHDPIHRVDNTQPSDVFKAILNTNRQLNLLLKEPFEPSDAYMQITRAIGYGGIFITFYPDVIPIPSPPAYEPDKNPSDVYNRLLACLREIHTIYTLVALPNLDFDATQIDKASITSSDVFDLSSLLVARLDRLYQQFDLKEAPPEAYDPGPKRPSDIYRRAGILLQQLQQLVVLLSAQDFPTLLHNKGSQADNG